MGKKKKKRKVTNKKRKIPNPFNVALIQARAHMNITPTKKEAEEKALKKHKTKNYEDF